MATAKTKNELPLQKKAEVLNYIKKNPGAGSRKVASVFICGKTQIQPILKKTRKSGATTRLMDLGKKNDIVPPTLHM